MLVPVWTFVYNPFKRYRKNSKTRPGEKEREKERERLVRAEYLLTDRFEK